MPYLRYFLARMLPVSSSTRRSARRPGWKGPLHGCSIYGSKEAGKRLQAMMAMGASRPWPDAMEALTGQRKADATALLDVLRAAARVAEEAERRPHVRLVSGPGFLRR